MISVKNLETLLRLAVSCREYAACSVRPEDLEDMARELLENRAKRAEEQILLLVDALKEIEWSNDSRWQSDRARAALAATAPKDSKG